MEALKAENIGVNAHYIPLHYFRPYGTELGYKKGDFPVAEDTYERVITLPLFPAMTNHDADNVVEAVRKVMTHYTR